MIAGRTIAEHLGNVADHLGYNGEQLTRDLIEGRTVQSQALVASIGFVQNFGINFGADRLFRYFGKNAFESARNVDDAARVLGKNSEDVGKSIDNTTTPLYDRYAEPHDVVDIDSAVPVSKPSGGRQFVNDEATVQAALARRGIGEDGLNNFDRPYFTNWSAVTDDASLQNVLKEATSTLKRLKGFPQDLDYALRHAASWWADNKGLIDDNLDALALNFKEGMTEATRKAQGVTALLGPKGPIETVLKEYSQVTDEGYIAASLVAEELGIRIQKLARQAINLDEAFVDTIDFSSTVENLLNLHEKANLFLIPLRRAKRQWAVDGTLQQRKQLKRVKDADIQGAIKQADPVSSNAPSESFQTIKVDDADPGSTLRQLYDKYVAGDDVAGQTLKDYLRLVAYSDPSVAVSQVSGLTNVLATQLRKGNTDATTNLFYFSMLSRAATQTASAASNLSRLIAEPIGAALSGHRAYGLGQFVGGWQALGDARQVLVKAIRDGKASNGGAKIDSIVVDLKQKNLQLDQLWLGAQKELNASNASPGDRFATWLSYVGQKAANSPLIATPGRLLLGADEWSKSIVASQIATGRAFQEAADSGIKYGTPEFEKLVKGHLNEVFRDGVRSGKIIDQDVLRVAKNISFQEDIPIKGNFVDNAFLAVQQAADNSGFWKFVSPFTRVSYNILEVSARYEPTGAFTRFLPKYKDILAGKLGDTAKLQLESQIAFGQMWSVSVAAAASAGFVTGVNSGNLPKQSFIIPANNKDGYIAIPYGKLEPFATITSVIADVVNGVREEVISKGEYEKFVSNIVFSLGMSSFDKTFMTGMADFGALFDARNLSEGSIKGFGNMVSTVSPGAVRMVADWTNPYKTISSMTNNPWETFSRQFLARAVGGHGNPIMYDELSGLPIPKVTDAVAGSDRWALVAASAFNELAFPGKITNAAKGDPIRQMLDKVSFKVDVASSIKTFEGISLNPDQQSILSKDLHDFGNLRGKLKGYFDSDRFKRLQREFNATRKADDPITGSSNEGTRANAIRAVIHQELDAIYRAAKMEAATQGRLRNDPDFIRKRYKVDGVSSLTPPTQNSGLQGLLSMANK